MDRIRVVGVAGSGKTTVASEMARRLSVDHLELDAVHWLPQWTERDPDEFRSMIGEFAARDRWVIDGNYQGRLGEYLDDLVDTYIWLDLPRWRVVSSTFWRTLKRGISGQELWATGNRERLRNLLSRDPTQNMVIWSWTQYRPKRLQFEAKQAAGAHTWVRLRSRSDVRRFLEGLGKANHAQI